MKAPKRASPPLDGRAIALSKEQRYYTSSRRSALLGVFLQTSEAQISLKPSVLIATTRRWIPTARLAMALANAGFVVDAVCPAGHPLSKTACTRKIYAYRGLAPLESFADAIFSARPELIIPGDDLATWHLHDLFAREKKHTEEGSRICDLLECSLGPSASFKTVYERGK